MRETNETLLQRVKRLDANDAWTEFFAIYSGPILRYSRKLGLAEATAEDVLQETMVALMRVLPGFVYDREQGRFRNFLLTIVHRKAIDVLRRARRLTSIGIPGDGGDGDEDLRFQTQSVVLPDVEDEAVALERWKESLYEEALVRIKEDPKLQANTWEVFSMYVLERRSASEVATQFGMTANAVYQIKNRMLRRLEVEVKQVLSVD